MKPLSRGWFARKTVRVNSMSKSALLMILGLLCVMPALAAPLLTPVPGKPAAPGYRLHDMDGEPHSLDELRGKVVILNFWATWCPPCRRELPAMNRAWKKVKGQGIVIVGINVGEDEDTVFAFNGEYPIDFPVLLDQEGEIVARWPVKGLPTTFVIDPQGRIVYRAIGGRDWDDDKLLDVVRGLRANAGQSR